MTLCRAAAAKYAVPNIPGGTKDGEHSEKMSNLSTLEKSLGQSKTIKQPYKSTASEASRHGTMQ